MTNHALIQRTSRAGKSTTLSILGGLLDHTSGSIYFDGSKERPSHGTLGIVPQKNVLFPELTCFQTLQVWHAIKAPNEENTISREDLEQLLVDCDLAEKVHENAGTLSGGQKRKLQLAIGLVGGSKSAYLPIPSINVVDTIRYQVVLVDEVGKDMIWFCERS